MTNPRYDLFPDQPPKGGWAQTVSELRVVAGPYAEALITEDTWTSVAASLMSGQAYEELPAQTKETLSSIATRRIFDMAQLGHPNVREDWFAHHQAHRRLQAARDRCYALADKARAEWLEAGGTLPAHMIQSAHQFAIYASWRDGVEMAA